MDFKLKNFGKIAEADIKLDGITVICGNNDTGKSTVGKALFAFFNSLCDLKNKIIVEKKSEIENFIFKYGEFDDIISSHTYDDLFKYHKNEFNTEEVKNYLDSILYSKISTDKIELLVKYLNSPELDIINKYVSRYFISVMNGQVENVNSFDNSGCNISGDFKDFANKIKFKNGACKCDLVESLVHSAYYINSPFVLNWLNNPDRINILKAMNPMDRSTVSAIIQAQADINDNPMTNILDSVINRAELEIVEDVLKKAYRGTTKISNGKYFYTDENGKDFDFRNISAGLKSFALIERMLETGVLKREDVLILDEPEIHLHSEWQIIYAELIVMLQKHFDLTILIVTHSFQFLESINYFMKHYKISDKGNYYMPRLTDKGYVMEYNDNNLEDIKMNLSTGTFKIADLISELEFSDDAEFNDGCK